MWTSVLTGDGSWTLRRGADGPTCHSTAGAWQQARERYAAACRLAEVGRERGVVRLLDVGTGLGLNLAAALRELDGVARLEAVSLESDRSVIEAARALEWTHGDWAPWIGLAHEALRVASEHADGRRVEFAERRGGVRLRLGDARDAVPSRRSGADGELFDAVFLDPFAPRDDPELWSQEFLAAVAASMAPHAILSTYCASLDVRARLSRSGLRIGLGARVGAKAQGTLASLQAGLPPLDARTTRRVERRASRGSA